MCCLQKTKFQRSTQVGETLAYNKVYMINQILGEQQKACHASQGGISNLICREPNLQLIEKREKRKNICLLIKSDNIYHKNFVC